MIAPTNRLTQPPQRGGYVAIVLHPVMLDWLGREVLEVLLDRVASAVADNELWVGRCADAADRVLADPAPFRGATILDTASWT